MAESLNPVVNLKSTRQRLYNPAGDIYTSWHDLYGAVHLACSHSGTEVPFDAVRMFWNHGVFLPFECRIPGRLLSKVELSTRIPIWLHHEYSANQVQPCANAVHVVGAPWLYVPAINEQRVSKSTLIMPGHTLFPTTELDNQHFETYVDELVKFVPPSDRTYVCLSSSCVANGYWITEFSRRGYNIIIGARHNDSNSLHRLKSYFNLFETVVSNTFGSHIAYAAYEGCKVGIWGHEIIDDFIVEDAWKKSDVSWSQYNVAMNAETSLFRCQPGSEEMHSDWGRFVLGADYKQSPAVLSTLLSEAQRYCSEYNRQKYMRRLIGLGARVFGGISSKAK